MYFNVSFKMKKEGDFGSKSVVKVFLGLAKSSQLVSNCFASGKPKRIEHNRALIKHSQNKKEKTIEMLYLVAKFCLNLVF